MAAPQFSTFEPRKKKTRRRFTLQEANRSLPLVTRVVRDIVNTHDRAMRLQDKLEESPASKEAAGVQEQFRSELERLQEYVEELEMIGVDLKDYETGLVDFPGRHQGREIFLCWKLGEEKVDHWHELHTGYNGRQPISALEE